MKKSLFLICYIALNVALVSCHGEAEQNVEMVENAVEDNHIYEYGIPVDLYEMESGTVKNGDTFSTILERCSVGQAKAYEVVEAIKGSFNVKTIRAGRDYHAFYSVVDSVDRVLEYLVYEASNSSVVVFSLKDNPSAEIIDKVTDTELKYAEVEINSSLWVDTQNSGHSPLLAIKLSDIYAWTIDFFGLQKGDKFSCLYEEITVDGELLDIGNVRYALFTHEGKDYECFYFEEEEGGNRYWNEKGESMRKAFLKAPLQFSRISSGFTYSRKHPITKRVQPHTGVDYAAPKGTPVVSIGDGVVTSAKYEGAGGNTIRIKHNSVYRSAYLHLSKYAPGIKAGVRVSQGQLIGYVGSTGSSTGPHLDFRVWKNDTPINPLKMESPAANPIAESNMEAFEKAKRDALELRNISLAGVYYKAKVLDPLSLGI
ncbi:MAG: peptidoglycan DD-metalloendopeptidase family protein [Bacteroidales bacterium]|nr:peptidoglycan DD-metalloendopeptidase family protein [Bacteroidales bacterium]